MDATTAPGRDAPALTAGGMLAIWHDVAPGRHAAIRDWYVREHHFERLAIPGFLDARRYERVSGTGADVFGCYGVQTPEVLNGEAYLARVQAPTSGTREAMGHIRNMCRTVCGVAASAGRAHGGVLATLAANGREPGALQDACERLLARPGVLRATALRAARQAPQASTEQALRGGRDAHIRWALLLEADSLEAAEGALDAAQAVSGCRDPVQFAVYRLCFAASNPS